MNTIFSKARIQLALTLGTMAVAVLVMVPSLARAESLTRQLDLTMTGTDVSALQAFLAQDSTIYPQGLVTGYFGFLTKAAVANFQSRNGIASVGRVGPVTLIALNAQMAGNFATSADVNVASISGLNVNPSKNVATVTWNTNEYARGAVYYSDSPLTTVEHLNSVDVSGTVAMTDTAFRTSQSVDLTNLRSDTNYYYLVYATDQAGNVSVRLPSSFRTKN